MEKLSNNKAKKFLEGMVVGDEMDKTVVVAVSVFKSHKKYLKRFLNTKGYKAHDPENKFKVGDKVKIVETRPISRGKKWEVIYNGQGTMISEQ